MPKTFPSIIFRYVCFAKKILTLKPLIQIIKKQQCTLNPRVMVFTDLRARNLNEKKNIYIYKI